MEFIRHCYFYGDYPVPIMRALLALACTLFGLNAFAQPLSQEVRGKVVDSYSSAVLPGASVIVSVGDTTAAVTTTDNGGRFRLRIPVGRYRLQVSHLGYEVYTHEILLIAAKETVVDVEMFPSAGMLDAVEVSAGRGTSVPGLRSLPIERTLRVPANFFDPVRTATAWPGVTATNDQNNTIIVRGNSPNGLLWRLNGLDIVNPNHQANAGTVSDKPSVNGGGVNILSAQMLDRTDFYLGALPVSYGNLLSGAVDMTLRKGNTRSGEYTAQASLIGLDVAAEGPIGKNGRSSFLVNYRYSTVGLLAAAGINFGGEDIRFQDISFHFAHETEAGSALSLFGFWGNGSNTFDPRPPAEREEEKDQYEIDFSSANYLAGISYKVAVGNGTFTAGAAWSSADQIRTAQIAGDVPPVERYLLRDRFSLTNGLFSSRLSYETRLNDDIVLHGGVMANHAGNDIRSFKRVGCLTCSFTEEHRVGSTVNGWLLQSFAGVRAAFSSTLSLDAGIRYVAFTFNNTNTLEPRAMLAWRVSKNNALELAYSRTSQTQTPQIYSAGNTGLDFTRSHRFDLSYRHTRDHGLDMRGGIYLQQYDGVPVLAQGSGGETFSALNLLEEFPAGPLVNQGTGRNYGIEASVEQSFFNHHYFMVGGTLYESKYTPADGVERDSRFNGNYMLSAVYGKEWGNTRDATAIGFNVRSLLLGGLPQLAVNVQASRDARETVYGHTFGPRMDDYFRIDVRVSFRKNKPRYTRTFALDIQNVLSRQNEGYAYYDFFKDEVITRTQLGIIPVLVYRIDF